MTNDTSQGETEARENDRPGISGKRLTALVLVSLALVGAALSYVLWTYNQIDATREDVRLAWHELAEKLSTRYGRIEKLVATRVDAREMDMESGERFRLAIDRFRTTAQAQKQFKAACEIEDHLKDLSGLSSAEKATSESVEKYNGLLAEEARYLDSPGGKFLSIFLNFPDPDPIELAE